MLTLQMLNSDGTLNNFFDIGSLKFMAGEDLTVRMRLIDSSKNLRYIPASGATFSLELLKSDGTTYSKAPSNPFSDDRSILEFEITAAESNEIVSQDLKLNITESSKITIAKISQGISKITSEGC